ncbi:MAG TPA: 1-deoxy-D-xylulose-5-phosphate reductoisomerase [Dissulfurispiraceae bacterium]|nr:1-deoxy-D-xylulose-5-phosphate reductoisomerase [Dissulfurispiraceae bacterium]
MKNIAILGSTGSIGTSTLDVAAKYPDLVRVVGLAAGRNVGLLREQIVRFRPGMAAVADAEARDELARAVAAEGATTEILGGPQGVCEIARMKEADTVISAIVGAAGLLPTIAAIRAGKNVALANKETLVMAGDIVNSEVKKSGVKLFPVDSEHSALFQCMNGSQKQSVKRLILTASGGPFLGGNKSALANITAADALRHPNWEMGKKITIDSATLMNKGLEVIEAHHLFDIPLDRIDVLVHPQSIVHSIVEFTDGSCLAQLSRPDMKGPIAYALSFPDRLEGVMVPLEWEKLSGLTFQKPDTETFPCLSIGYEAAGIGGTMPAVLNAANEIAVHAFLDGLIGFNNIPDIIKKTMDAHNVQEARQLDVVLEADRWARAKALEVLKG